MTDLPKPIETVCFDREKREQFGGLAEFISQSNLDFSAQDQAQLLEVVETAIVDQLTQFAFLIYQRMQLSQDWGDAGEQQVKQGFCRILLNIPPDVAVDYTHLAEFETVVAKALSERQLADLTLKAIKAQFDEFGFKVLSHVFKPYDVPELNHILQFLGSKNCLQGGYYGDDQEYIFGKARGEKRGPYSVYMMQKEQIRTPNNIMAMAAVIGRREVFVREEALATIFAQKWVPAVGGWGGFSTSDSVKIADYFRSQTLSAFGVKTAQDLENIKATMLADMGETILCHELGHGVIQHDILDKECSAIGEASRLFGENIYTAFHEWFAEFAPERDGIWGPMANMAKIAEKDLRRATRMYWMYLSDTWFFDTPDTYMYLYSELMAASMAQFVDEKDKIDFERLGQACEQVKGRLMESMIGWFEADMPVLKAMAEKATFKVGGRVESREWAKKRVEREMNEAREKALMVGDDDDWRVGYWSKYFELIKTYSPTHTQKIKTYLDKRAKKIVEKLMVVLIGKEAAQNWNYDLQAYTHKKWISHCVN